METVAEKRNLGQIATPSFVGVPNRLKAYALNISGTFRHRKLKFYTHLDRVNHTLWVQFFFARGMQGAQHPLVKIWDTVYISESIRARKSRILQTLRQCQILIWGMKIFRKGVPGAQRPIV